MKTVVVQPKRVICSGRFGVQILFRNKQYIAIKDKYHSNMYKVEAKNGLAILVPAKHLEVVENCNERELLEQAIEDATEAIAEKAGRELENHRIDGSDDILFVRDDMETAWRAVQAVESSKNVRQVLQALTRYIGRNEANKIIKV